MASQNSVPTGPSFAIKRRPVSVAHRSPAQSASSLPSSQLPSPQPSANLLDFQDISTSSQQQSTSSASDCPSTGVANSENTSGLPTPPPSATSGISQSPRTSPEFQRAPVFFPPLETGSLPTPPPSARPEQSYFSLPPSSTAERTPDIPPRPTNPTSSTRQTGPAPAGPRPAFSSHPSNSSNSANFDTGTPHPVYRSKTQRFRDGVNRYCNKETANRAYSNGIELLGKTSDRLGRIIDPLMPVLSVTNPDFASTYQQINQAGAQGSILPLVGALAQVTLNDNTGMDAGTAQSFLDMLNQQQAALGASSGEFDPSGYIAALMQNGASGVNADVINSYIQQPSNATMASFQANMANMQGGSSVQNPFLDLMAAAQSGDSTQLMNQIIQQQQQQQQAAMANLAAWSSMPTNPGTGGPSGPASFAQEATPTNDPTAASQSSNNTVPGEQNDQTSSVPPAQSSTSPGNQDQRQDWTPQSIPKFGIGNISLPVNHNLRVSAHNVLAGELADLSGYFEMKLLYSSRQVVDEMASMQELRSDDDMTILEPCAMIDFGIPCGGVSVSCALAIKEPDEEGVIPAMYRVLVQSPYGHGILLSYFVAAENLHALKTAAKTLMVSSIGWVDRATLCDSIVEKLVGEWRWGEETPLIDLGDGFQREWKQLTFTTDGRYQYQKGGGTTSSTQDTAEAEPESGPLNGRFEAFEYRDGSIHLVLTGDHTSGVEVQEIILSKGSMTVQGKTYCKIAPL